MRLDCPYCHTKISGATSEDSGLERELHIVKDHPELRIQFSDGGQL